MEESFLTPDELGQMRQKLDELATKANSLDAINAFARALLEANSVDAIIWTVARQAIARLGYVDCVVYLFNEDRSLLVQRAAHGPKNPISLDIHQPLDLKPGEGIVGAAAASGKPQLVVDTRLDSRYVVDDKARLSEIAVPLVVGGLVLGVIDSEHPEVGFYTETHVETLETIAAMTATQLLRTQAEEALSAERARLQTLFDNQTEQLRTTLHSLQQSHDEISERNAEKATLLKEIHHRVKNNMQIVISLLNLSAQEVETVREAQVFKDCQARIRSMAMIHERLYAEDDLSRINAKRYIKGLTQELLHGFRPERQVIFQLEVEETDFSIEHFMPVGLIINELVVNALKHAFPPLDPPADSTARPAPGIIKIKLTQVASGYNLLVVDNGVGIRKNASTSSKHSIGMELVETLANQLDGTMTRPDTANGTAFSFDFTVPEERPRFGPNAV